eukprot:354777-Chlamydomonas_euryale.AAC.5
MQGCAAECTILLPYPPPYTPPIVRIPYRTESPSSTYWPYRATLHDMTTAAAGWCHVCAPMHVSMALPPSQP